MQFSTQGLLNRATWLKIHLYLALIVGFFFALMGLTGSISIYREGLDELLNPQLVISQPSGKRQSLDKIIAAVQTAHPNRYGSWTLEMPSSAHGMITVWYDKPRETFFELYAPLMVSVNPYTAEVVASRFWGRTATTWLLDLHTQLGLDSFGWNAVGVLGLLLMVSIGTGVYLWWPGLQGIRALVPVGRAAPALPAPAPDGLYSGEPCTPSLAIAAPAPGGLAAFTPSLAIRIGRCQVDLMRLAFGLHRWIGLLSAPVLLVLAFTGFHLSYPAVLMIARPVSPCAIPTPPSGWIAGAARSKNYATRQASAWAKPLAPGYGRCIPARRWARPAGYCGFLPASACSSFMSAAYCAGCIAIIQTA